MPNSFATLQTVACQAPLSMRFPRQEYWSGLPFPSPITFKLKFFRVLLNFNLLMTIDPKTPPGQGMGNGRIYYLQKVRRTPGIFLKTVIPNSNTGEFLS